MEFWHVVGDITILLSVAVLLGIISEKLGFSGVVGYLIAGTLVGPGLLDWVSADEESIRSIAEIGVALLLFTIGLEINGHRLKQLLGNEMLVGILQIVITGMLGFVIARFFGVPLKASIIVGAMGGLSSTAVVSRVLQDRSELDSSHGRLAFGVLLVQDLAIVPLMLLVAFLHDSSEQTELVSEVGAAGAKFVALIVIVFLIGVLVLPRFFGAALIRRSSEFPVIVGIVTCLSSMWLADQLDLSPALGAFIVGVILAGSPFAAQVRGDMAPFRFIFLTLFFAVTGMLADLPWLVESYHWLWTLGVVVSIVVGKSIIVLFVASIMKHPRRVSISAGLCLAQIGEFSFVIGAEALNANLLDDNLFQLMMSSSLITLLISPYLIGKARVISKHLDSYIGSNNEVEVDSEIATLANHVVVIGYGVAGVEVVADLLESGQEVLVIDMGQVGVSKARKDGAHSILGNAQRREILEHSGIRTAKLLVSTLPDHRASVQTIQQIRAFAPTIPIIARARYSIHGMELTRAGADVVVDEEKCVGNSISQRTMQQIGL
ncbi:MAG: cation:proton antiporter [Phycisphaerales bacterium]|jgi:CPA2 family monovalent cation:H+ antiporter-2|nr:cation:proton antiporter [Phycisphaerales bacterium]